MYICAACKSFQDVTMANNNIHHTCMVSLGNS